MAFKIKGLDIIFVFPDFLMGGNNRKLQDFQGCLTLCVKNIDLKLCESTIGFYLIGFLLLANDGEQ